MKITITIIIFISSLIFAQQKDTLIQYNLGEIEVIGKKENSLNSISISQKDFQMLNAFSVSDALQFSPGIYISISARNESQISLRGFDQRQISIMIDGAPVYIPYDGSFDLYAFQLSGYNKIEVSKNTPSILYGPNSMGGSINLISDESVKPFSARLNYEMGSSQNLGVGLNGLFSAFYWNAGFGYLKSDGFQLPESFVTTKNEDGGKRNNSNYESKTGTIKFGTKIADNFNAAFSFNFVDNQKGVPIDIYTPRPRYWKFTEWNKSLSNLMFNSTISSAITIKGNIFYEKFKNVLDSYDDNTYSTQTRKYAFHSTYDDHSYGMNLSSFISTSILPLTKMIFLYKRDTHTEQGNYNNPFQKYEAEILTAGVEEEFFTTTQLKNVIGISYDRMNPLYANGSPLRSANSSVNGNVGLYYKLNDNLNFHLNASRKTRFPTLKEFYSELLGSYIANPNLSPEVSYIFDLGTAVRFSNVTLFVSLFYSDIKDLIQRVVLPDNMLQYQNVNKANYKGIEFETKYSFSFINATFNYTFLSSKNITENKELPNRPVHVVNLLLNQNYALGFSWNLESTFIGEQYSFDSYSGELKRLPDYLLLNFKVSYNFFLNYSIYFRVNNITDKLYETSYGFPQPGREFFVGISAKW